MRTELEVRATQLGGMRFEARAGEQSVAIDYPLRDDEAPAGFTPLELLLASLAGCAADTLVALLARMEQPCEGIAVQARAQRRTEHPTVLTDIALRFDVQGVGVDPVAVGRALGLAEDRLCPVWAMLKGGGTRIVASYEVLAN